MDTHIRLFSEDWIILDKKDKFILCINKNFDGLNRKSISIFHKCHDDTFWGWPFLNENIGGVENNICYCSLIIPKNLFDKATILSRLL